MLKFTNELIFKAKNAFYMHFGLNWKCAVKKVIILNEPFRKKGDLLDSSGREEKRGRAKGDYFSEIITFIAELQDL